ncbi:MAG: sugar ABC transporter ATP-binding protein [Actinobacteria bacterium]|nr:sugar ABC transporter ATP-binding protein [Actinomycetota bacterium]
MAGQAPALALTGASKSFNGRTVMHDVSLTVGRGEVHGLVGANGAGKSTLIKTVSGFHAPDGGGSLRIGEATLPLPAGPGALMAAGARFVHQDLGLMPSLSIAENFTLEPGLSARAFGLKTRGQEEDACRARLRRFGLDHDPRTLVGDLAVSEQVLVAVVRAVTDAAGATTLLVLDEATSGLPWNDAGTVLELIRRTAADGVGVLFVSHRLDEVLGVCDSVTVLRDGHVVGALRSTEGSSQWSLERLTASMFGAAATASPTAKAAGARPADTAPRLRVAGLRGAYATDVSFDLAPGEILGLTGVVEAEAGEIGRILFGAARARGGEITLEGERYRPRSPRAAKSAGVAYVAASRDLSLLKSLSVTENATLADLGPFGSAYLRRGAERAATQELLDRFQVSPPDPGRVVGTLSGGNQQKVALLRWLRTDPRVLVLHEPCRGVDINARAAIYRILRDAAAQGLSVLVISSEIEEAAEICDRVLVLVDGRVDGELSGAALTPESLMQALNPGDAHARITAS